ncbi:amidase [Lampropedia aestuarii]|uniref:Amidase n=2 Tax=Lampropedia aestuarii TaxID=2562762 RepID=A0A4S5BH28_9BURK|nr:amidase [Lampropedia aestuarii]
MGCMQQLTKPAWTKEADIQAFAWTAPEPAPDAQAQAQTGQTLPLAGQTFGVKDVIDVQDMPTQFGCAGMPLQHRTWDATVVAQLRAAGALPVGKTVTAEFAYSAPGPTRNPWNLAHTPGGSSSGSAAAVAAGMVDFALGTQTGGSIVRPAAFCGVVGFKPSFGLVHRQGMLVTAETLDTIGWFTPDIASSAQLLSVITQSAPLLPRTPKKVAWAAALPGLLPEMQHLLAAVKKTLHAADIAVQDMSAQQHVLDALAHVHGLTVRYELARGMLGIASDHGHLLSPNLQNVIREGMAQDTASYWMTQQQRHALSHTWLHAVGDAELIIAPSTYGPAPVGLGTTGSSLPNRPWSVLGWPCVHVPLVCNAQGLPMGVQLIAKPAADADLLAMAQSIQALCADSAMLQGSACISA